MNFANINLFRPVLVMLSTVAASLSLCAQTTTFTDEASFLASLQPGYYTQALSGSGSVPSLPETNGTFAYTINVSSSTVYQGPSLVGANIAGSFLTVNITSGNVTAIGGNFFYTNISDVWVPILTSLTLNNGTNLSYTPTSLADTFFGFTTQNNAFITSLTFDLGPTLDENQNSVFQSISSITVGNGTGITAVPEPSTYGLMGAGALAALGFLRRRKSNKA